MIFNILFVFFVVVLLCFLFVVVSHEASRSRVPKGGWFSRQWLK